MIFLIQSLHLESCAAGLVWSVSLSNRTHPRLKSQFVSQMFFLKSSLLWLLLICTCKEHAVLVSVQNVWAFIHFLFIFYYRAILTQDVGYEKAGPINLKVASRKMNLRGKGRWVGVTRTQATQGMKIRLRGTTQGIFLYMCLRLTSLSFLRRARYTHLVSDL